jgi:hypothetical protein
MELPQELKDAAKNRNLIPFIGAGFSKNINKSIPDFSGIVKIAAERLGYSPKVINEYVNNYQIFEYFQIQNKGINELLGEIQGKLNDDTYAISESTPHLLLPYIDTHTIYTTNWDNWIEKGFEHENVAYTKMSRPQDLIISKLSKSPASISQSPATKFKFTTEDRERILTKYQHRFIIKFHGDFIYPDEVVLTQTSYYNRLDFEHPFDIRLRSDLLGKSALFIGYSFADLNISYLWHKLNNIAKKVDEQPKSFFVTSSSNEILREIFKKMNIVMIEIDSQNRSKGITELFNEIINIQKRAPRSKGGS